MRKAAVSAFIKFISDMRKGGFILQHSVDSAGHTDR